MNALYKKWSSLSYFLINGIVKSPFLVLTFIRKQRNTPLNLKSFAPSVTSTQKYAKHDTDVIEAYLQHANQYVTQQGEDSIRTIREEFHARQLEALRAEAKRIQGIDND